jgi:hypothetical protein
MFAEMDFDERSMINFQILVTGAPYYLHNSLLLFN